MSPAPWHPADTLAQLKKRGTNMGRLAEQYGVILLLVARWSSLTSSACTRT
jgi:lambda repressor-like predicted transcriptional regulator